MDGNNPTDVDPFLDAFHAIVWNNLIRAGLAALFAQVPFLGLPIISNIVTWIVMKFSDYLYAGFQMFVDIQYIRFKNQQLQTEYDKSSVALQVIAYDHGIDSKEFEDARQGFEKDLSKFGRYDVAR